MSVAIKLREYQEEAVSALEQAWERGVRRPAVVLPTGMGKTVAFSELAERWVGRNRLSAVQRVLVIAHRDELIEQAAAKIRSMAPHLRVGIVKAERDNVSADVVVASVQTLRSERRRNRIVHVGLVIVDECHHAVADTYLAVLRHYGCFDGGAVAAGFTATMTRGDDLGLGEVWQEVVYTKDIHWGVSHGFLAPPRGKLVEVDDLDLRKIRKQGGDYQDKALGEAIEGSMAPRAVAQAYREHSEDRQGILFAPTVHCAGVYQQGLEDEGFKVGMIHGAMPTKERADTLEAYRQGDLNILTNCMVMTEGTDLPMTSTIVVGRPTKSKGLYTQMVGRGLRLWPGKRDALVLIVAAKAAQNSLSTPVELFGDKPVEQVEAEETELDEAAEFELGLTGELPAESVGVPDAPDFLDGPIKVTDIDLFHASKNDWRMTHGGIWFLPAGDRLIVLKPQDNGLWGVVWCDKYQTGQNASGWVAQDVADMGYAMAFAEANVSPSEARIASKNARWKKNAPSDAMKGYARRLGIIVTEDMKGGELSGLMSVEIASRRIDPYLARR